MCIYCGDTVLLRLSKIIWRGWRSLGGSTGCGATHQWVYQDRPHIPVYELLWIRLKATRDSDSMLFGALYHPPKPSYKTSDLYEHIERSFDEVLRTHPDDIVVLAGDFNQLSLAEVSARTGLTPLVSVPTRGTKILI